MDQFNYVLNWLIWFGKDISMKPDNLGQLKGINLIKFYMLKQPNSFSNIKSEFINFFNS